LRALEKIVTESGPFDVVVAEELVTAKAMLWLKSKCHQKTVFVSHNVEIDLYNQMRGQTLVGFFRKKWLMSFEKKVLASADLTFVYSEVMRKRFGLIYGVQNLLLTSAGIEMMDIACKKNRQGRKTIFIGALDYYPNIDAVRWFAENVLPKLKNKIDFVVAGGRPLLDVERLSSKNHFTLHNVKIWQRSAG
jgi:hypothetical protein